VNFTTWHGAQVGLSNTVDLRLWWSSQSSVCDGGLSRAFGEWQTRQSVIGGKKVEPMIELDRQRLARVLDRNFILTVPACVRAQTHARESAHSFTIVR
jgi:hypothetical protein